MLIAAGLWSWGHPGGVPEGGPPSIFEPGPVPIRRSPKPRPAVGRRAVLELTDREAAHLARFPLILTDAHGGRILVPAGTGDGDQLVLHDRGELIVLHVRVYRKDLTVLD